MMFLLECWKILCELAPWQLLGILLSGLLEFLQPKNFFRRQLTGTRGFFAWLCPALLTANGWLQTSINTQFRPGGRSVAPSYFWC